MRESFMQGQSIRAIRLSSMDELPVRRNRSYAFFFAETVHLMIYQCLFVRKPDGRFPHLLSGQALRHPEGTRPVMDVCDLHNARWSCLGCT